MTDSEQGERDIIEDNMPSEEELEAIRAENERMLEQYLSRGDAEAPEVSEALPAEHRSGYVAVIGKPNVGKSTLMNALLGEKLAIVSPKPQTTRDRQLGIYTDNDVQIVFIDTPGIHKARNKLGEYMVEAATGAMPDADVILFIVDVSGAPTRADEAIAQLVIDKGRTPAILALNKGDLLGESGRGHATAYESLVPDAEPVMVSALKGEKVDELLEMIIERLPEGPRYFPADLLTETQVRDNVAELIREQALMLYEEEIPHSLAVQVTEFKERSADMTYIAATIFVERDSQKRIVIGKQGAALKQLGKQARAELEAMLGTQVYLDLWVKVMKNWRKDENALRRLGYEDQR